MMKADFNVQPRGGALVRGRENEFKIAGRHPLILKGIQVVK
jgi:hypothetical protein